MKANELLPSELWSSEIYSFLDDSSICSFEKVCTLFNNISIEKAKEELTQFLDKHNNYFEHPLRETPIKEEELKLVESRIGIKLPNIVREFLKITNGRNPVIDYYSGFSEHFTNTLSPFQGWYMRENTWRNNCNTWINIGGAGSERESFSIYLNIDTCQLQLNYCNCTEKNKTIGFRDYIFGLKYTSNPYNNSKLCENRELLKEVLFKNGSFIFGKKLIQDREFVKQMLLEKCDIYRYLSKDFRKEFWELGLSLNINNYRFVPDSIKLKRDLAMKYIENNAEHDLKEIPKEILDKEMILKSGKLYCGLPSQFVNEEITLTILNTHPFSMKLYDFITGTVLLHYLSIRTKLYEIRPICVFHILQIVRDEEFQFDKSTILKCFDTFEPRLIECYRKLIAQLPNELLCDFDIAKECLLFSFKNYSKLSDELKMNRELMKECLKSMTSCDFEWLGKEKKLNPILYELAFSNPSYRIYLEPESISEDFINSLTYYPYNYTMFLNVMTKTRFQHHRDYFKLNQESKVRGTKSHSKKRK